MLSKNNNRELKRKMEEKQDRFTIKKLSVGVASVLLGSFIMGTQAVQTAHASDDNTEDATVNSAQNTTMEQVVSLTNSTSQTSASNSQATSNAQAADSTVASSAAQSAETNVASSATTSATSASAASASPVSESTELSLGSSQVASTTLSNRALSSSLVLAANATTASGATQTPTSTPTAGYSVTPATPEYASGYSESNVPLDPNTAHYTVNSYEVVSLGSGSVGENGKKGLGNRYAYSVSESDVNGTGLPTKFYFMKFDSDNNLVKTVVISTDAAVGTTYEIDDYAQVDVSEVNGTLQFNLRKNVDDTNRFKPIYSVYGNTVRMGEAVNQELKIPEWVTQVTTYKKADGTQLKPDFVQYGWEGSNFTTNPIENIPGYDVRATSDYVDGQYDANIPASQKNGQITKGTLHKQGEQINSILVKTRGTQYTQAKIIDDKGTVEIRQWFTYAKADGTFDPNSTTNYDKGRVAATLPPADYDFINNPDGYTILDPTKMVINNEAEVARTEAGLKGEVVFQQVRYRYSDPANHQPQSDYINGGKANQVGYEKDANGKETITYADYTNPQKSVNHVILPIGTTTWGTYDLLRTTDAINSVVFPSDVNYVYWTQTATITYIDDTTGKVLHTDNINGQINSTSKYSPNSDQYSGSSTIGYDNPRTTKTIGDYEKEGYVLVSNNFPTNGVVFNTPNTPQSYEIHFVEGAQKITPNTPADQVPTGTPENAQPNALKKEVTLTVNYVNSDKTEFTGKIPAEAKQTITFNGLAYVNKVTGELVNAKRVNNEWIVDKDNTATPAITWTPEYSWFKYVNSPKETGYYIDHVSPDHYEDGHNVAPFDKITKDSVDIKVTVTYSPYTKVVNRQDVNASQIVKYVDEQGNELSPIKSQTFQFKYSGDTVNRDTNVLISKGKWNETIYDFDPQDVPVIEGYVAVKGYTRDDNDKVVAGGFTTTPEATEARRNRTYTVVYKKVGSIVPQDPNGNPIPDPSNPGQNVPNVPYTNDPIDPTKVTPDEPTPTIPGYTPSVNTVTPPDPTKDTPVVYTKNVEEKAKVQYIDLDENNRVMSESNTLTGKAGETINYSTADSIADYEKQGYVLVNDGFSDNPVFDNVDGNEQIFKVTFRHGRIPVGPDTPDKHGVDPSEVTKNVKETVHYVGAGDKTPADNVQTSKWTRTVTVDVVTGNVIADGQYTTDWSIAKGEKSVYDQVDTPIVEGYHADKRQVNATAVTQNDIEVTVTYTPNGKIIPVGPDGKTPIPDAPTPQYPTDPTDPTKVTPDEPVPTIPGYVPSVPTVTPTDPGKDTPVPYNPVVPAKDQAAVINYVDADDNNSLITSSGTLAGKAGEKIKYSTAETIADLEKKGYVLVTNGFDPEGTAPVYDSDDNTTQVFTVVLKHGTVPVTPTDPGKPGEPISPDNPDIKWPEGTGENSLKKTGTQTIHYVYADGTKAKDDNVQSFDFTKSGVVDKVTGKLISETNWNVSSHTFGRVDSPVIEGYHANKRVAGGETVTPDDLSKEVTVTYTPNGKIIPVDPSGKPIPDVPTPQYPTDPTDPTKVTPDEPVPTIPGYVPSVPTVTPTDPGKDTPVPYNPVVPAKDQAAVVNYVDADDNNSLITSSGNLTGKGGETINYSTAATIADLEKKGYVLVTNGFDPNGTAPKYDSDDNTTQVFTVILKHGTVPVTPTDPGKPGEPISPDNPDIKWPEGTGENSLKKTGTQTIHYVYADGTKAKDDNVQSFDFTKSGVVDKVTGKLISETNWNVSSHTFGRVDSPVIEGYHADKRVAGGETVTPDDLSKEVTVTYTPNGKIIPVDPSGKPIPDAPTPQYPTDPTDPTKVTPDEPVPTIPGYTPSVPTVTPTDPGKDTPVPYNPVTPVVNDQNAVVNYVDQDNNNAQIATSGNLTGKAGSAIDYSTAATIKQLEDQGYVLVSDGFPTGAVFDNDDNTTQTYTVVLKHGTTTFKPDKPGTPGEPINPNYPDGPKVTNEDVDYLKDVKFTVHYVGAGAKNPADNVQNAQWTRSITVDNVTGKIISSTEWVSNKASYNDVRTPVVEGYHADRAQVDGTTVTMEDQEVTVTYAPNGKIIPVDPNGNPIPNVPTPQYPTDPTDPTKVVPNEPVPTVPGYTPDVPTVTPTNPGEDTPVTYTPETPVVPTTPGDNGGDNGNHTPSTPTDENNVAPEVPGTSTTPESKVDVPSQNGNKTSNQNTNTQASKQSAKALPQTGDERLKYEGLLGVLALGFAGLLTLGKKRRKEK